MSSSEKEFTSVSKIVDETEEIEFLGPIVERATEVTGNRDEALRWLGTPIRVLRYATPVSLLGSPEGRDSVMLVLGRLEHGLA